MTLQLRFPDAFFAMASSYSASWDERAQLWWARRVMDGSTWRPLENYGSRSASSKVDSLVGSAVVQYGHRAEIEVIVPRFDAYVAEMQRQLQHGHTIAMDWPTHDGEALNSVRDWLASLDERMLSKLWKLSWAQGLEHATRWHVALAKAAEDAAAGEKDISRRIESHDGWTWCRLGSEWAMDREGAVMGHCVGQGSYDHYAEIDSDTAGIWSLRDDKGRSHVTVEIGHHVYTGVNRIMQAKGPKNRDVPSDQQSHIMLLSKELKLAVPEHGAMPRIDRIYAAWMNGFMRRAWMNVGEWADAEIDVERVDNRIVPVVRGAVEMTLQQTEPLMLFEEGLTENELPPSLMRERTQTFYNTTLGKHHQDGTDIPAGSVVTRQHGGIVLALDSQGGEFEGLSDVADAIAEAPKRTRRTPPPQPHYRQHERRGRLHGRT